MSATPQASERELTLEPVDNARLAALCGPLDAHLRQVEARFGVSVRRLGNRFRVVGARAAEAARVLEQLYAGAGRGVEAGDVHLAIQEAGMRDFAGAAAAPGTAPVAGAAPAMPAAA